MAKKTKTPKPRLRMKRRGRVHSEWSGAQVSRLATAWGTSPKPIDEDLKSGLNALRSRTREQAQNNDYVRRFLSLVKTNVAGAKGVVLQAKAADSTGKPLAGINTALESAWMDWGRYGVCETTGTMTWKQLQRLVIETAARDGEVLLRKHPEWDGNRFKFALEIIDPGTLDPQHNGKWGANQVVMGVELDSWRRPVAYHFRSTAKTATSYQATNGHRYNRIPADQMYHLFLPEWVWQTRGIPWVSTGLMALKQLDAYNEAELVGSRLGASKMGFYTSAEGAEWTGDGETSDGDLISEAEPGMFEKLPSGVEFTPWDPSHPNQAYADFIKANLRQISSGLGVSYNSLANDLEGVNYSSLRQGALEERATWMLLQDWFVDYFVDRVFRDWLGSALKAGAIRSGGRRIGDGRFDQLTQVRWQPPRWPWVDPLKDATANEKLISLGLKSRTEIIREQGRDPEEVWQELAEEQERLEELGIPQQPAEAGFLMPEENDANTSEE